MEKNVRLRILSYGVIVYLLLAFSWWSILLFVKNKDAYLAKAELLRIALAAEGLYVDEATFRQNEAFLLIEREYKRQEWMIMGEAGVFVISLIIALSLINRSYHKEMEAAQQRRNFLLSITHELKSPIASIQLVLETFLRRQLSTGKIEALSTNALQETQRLNQLVNNLLLSAKLETAYQPFFEAVDLKELITQLVTMLQTKHPKANIQFSTTEPEGVWIEADRMGLTSVIINLLENALKYSEAPAELEIALQEINGHWQIEVADYGIGISDKDKEKIFEKFYRVGNEDTRKTKGTGLGLYIVKEIVEAHAGKISVADHIPKGTVFTVQFPISDPPENLATKMKRALDQKV